MRQAVRTLPIILLLVAAVACKKSGPQNSDDLPFNQGGTQLQDPVRSIVSLSPGCTEVLLRWGASNFVVGRTQSCDWPNFVKKYPIMASVKPDWEKIAHAVHKSDGTTKQPDLIVYDPNLYNADEVAMMQKVSRVPPFALDGNTVDEFINELKKLSATYSGEIFMTEYIDNIRSAERAAQADPVTPTPTVALIMPGQGSEHMIAGVDSFYADEIKQATGKPVGPKGDKYVTLNAESLIQMNPDIILIAGDSTSFVKDPRFQGLSAIKNKRVIQTDADVLERRGARVDQLIGNLHNSMADMMSSSPNSSGASK